MQELFQNLWDDYGRLTPDAPQIQKVLTEQGEKTQNDHIALRTFNRSPLRINDVAKIFIKEGYRPQDQYVFEDKKLAATYFAHADGMLPKVFISELELEKCSAYLRGFCEKLVLEAEKNLSGRPLQIPARPWEKIAHRDYQKLMAESEYAAWVSAYGLRANHFTVLVNPLKTIRGIDALNAFLKARGFILNEKGGAVKGSEKDFLKQSSTMARTIPWEFSDGKFEIASCYYEFAERFPLDKSGKLFQGFVTQSANKIFESTDIRKK